MHKCSASIPGLTVSDSPLSLEQTILGVSLCCFPWFCFCPQGVWKSMWISWLMFVVSMSLALYAIFEAREINSGNSLIFAAWNSKKNTRVCWQHITIWETRFQISTGMWKYCVSNVHQHVTHIHQGSLGHVKTIDSNVHGHVNKSTSTLNKSTCVCWGVSVQYDGY